LTIHKILLITITNFALIKLFISISKCLHTFLVFFSTNIYRARRFHFGTLTGIGAGNTQQNAEVLTDPYNEKPILTKISTRSAHPDKNRSDG